MTQLRIWWLFASTATGTPTDIVHRFQAKKSGRSRTSFWVFFMTWWKLLTLRFHWISYKSCILIGGVIANSLPHENTGAPDRQAHPFAYGHRCKPTVIARLPASPLRLYCW